MSPIVYVPSKQHECEPPGQGNLYNTLLHSELMYPEGTIWECDECGSDWELDYDWHQARRYEDVQNGSRNARVIWNRLDD